jgi:hypothetical protein
MLPFQVVVILCVSIIKIYFIRLFLPINKYKNGPSKGINSKTKTHINLSLPLNEALKTSITQNNQKNNVTNNIICQIINPNEKLSN